jgi:hypothetical protein
MSTLPDRNRNQPYHDEHLYVDLRHELVRLDRADTYPDSQGILPIGTDGAAPPEKLCFERLF